MFLPVILLMLLVAQAHADDAFLEVAKEAKARDVEAARVRFEECNERVKAGIKSKDIAESKKARAELSAASKELSRARNKKIEEYVAKAEEDAAAAARTRVAKRQENEKKSIATEERLAKLRKIGPIFIDNAVVATNGIGLPELNFTVRNVGSDTVEAFDVEALCLNSFDEPVKGFLTGSTFSGACATVVRPGEEKILSVQLSLHSGTHKAMVRITRAKLGSGQVWVQSLEEAKEIPGAIYEAKSPR